MRLDEKYTGKRSYLLGREYQEHIICPECCGRGYKMIEVEETLIGHSRWVLPMPDGSYERKIKCNNCLGYKWILRTPQPKYSIR